MASWEEVLDLLEWKELRVELPRHGEGVHKHAEYTVFAQVPHDPEFRSGVVDRLVGEDRHANRAVGSLVGCAVGDAVGAPLEFLPVRDFDKRKPQTGFELEEGGEWKYAGEMNKFRLKRGQWTDDCAMALCMADSLLHHKAFDGSDVRVRFHNWWFNSYNNAFRLDGSRSGSVGLGGNISNSLYSMEPGKTPTPRFEAQGTDAGNGSLMRLAPVPIFFHADVAQARDKARESSFTTHPGPIAAEACAFMAHVIAKAIVSEEEELNAKVFLDGVTAEYAALIQDKPGTGAECLRKLLASAEPDHSLERNWNWKSDSLDLAGTLQRRGYSYNGYPVSAGYFGSYCMDGLAMALHGVYHTASFDEAVHCVVNMLGDADTIGSIAGQIAGAIYGYQSISPHYVRQVNQWDQGEIALRGALLYKLGQQQHGKAGPGVP